MLTFNSFRSLRYLRTLFSDGRYLLASENSDLELEMIDKIRQSIKQSFGNVSVGVAWKALYNSQTSFILSPGTSWNDGLPFVMRDGRDHLVSGSVSVGQRSVVPTGVTLSDSDSGKIATFTLGTTPSGQYTVVISAEEQVITASSDPFLQNVNVPEQTGSKIRLVYGINIVPTSQQSESPVPYLGDGYFGDTSGAGSTPGQNLVNKINVVCPSGASIVNLMGTGKNIDGRSYEVTISNNSVSGPIPAFGSGAAVAFTNGRLIDTSGQIYWLNGITGGTSSSVTLRLDAEINQLAPTFTTGGTFTMVKADVYSTTDSGSPQGKLFLPVATVNWDIANGFVHSSSIVDIRDNVLEQDQFEQIANDKYALKTVGGGTFTLASDSSTLNWDSSISLQGPNTAAQSISAGSGYLVDGGFLVYQLNFNSIGDIRKGSISTNSTTSGTSISLSGSPNLSSVSVGNVYVIGTQAAEIIAIDNINKVLTLASSVSTTGAGTIYLDSYSGNSYPIDENTYVLATRLGNTVYVAGMALVAGQSGKIGEASPSGIVKVQLYDPVDTTLPSGSTATIDGVAVSNGDWVLFSNLSSGNNQVYEVSGVGSSLSWTVVGAFTGNSSPSEGDLVIFAKGVQFGNQIAEFNGTSFQVNNTVRYFNGTDFWEQSAVQTTTLNDNSSGTIFSVTSLGSENIIVDFSIKRGTIKEIGTLWLTNDGTNAYLATGGTNSSSTGITFSAALSGSDVVLSYTATSTGTSANIKYSVKRWADGAGGPTGLPSYSPGSPLGVVSAAFVMSDNSGTPLNCNPVFNVSGLTNVTLSFSYSVGANAGLTVGDLEIYLNGQRVPRFVSGVTLDGYYTEINSTQIQFNADLTGTPLSIEMIKRD